MAEVARAAFGKDHPGLVEAARARVDGVAVVRAGDGRPLAFTSYRRGAFGGARCVYFDATATVPAAQRAGLVPRAQGRVLLPDLARRPWRTVHHVIRTRSPVALRASQRAFGPDGTHPRLDGSPPPSAVRRIAEDVAAWLGQADALDADLLRIRGAYAGLGGLYGEERAPATADGAADALVGARLGPDDALLVIGAFDLRAALRRLGRATGSARAA